jgi:signal transduction histidine kinase/DNA-binding response OmpR family regulator
MQLESTQSPRRILIIDDNPSIHSDFAKILAYSGRAQESLARKETELFGPQTAPVRRCAAFDLSSAFQGEEALRLVREAVAADNPFALAFVDVRMPPGLDGIETTARLWEIDPDLQVVICTAYSDYSWVDMLGKLGNSDRMVILKKPFDTMEVLQMANALTEKWQLLQATKRRMDELEKLVAERTRHLQGANEQLEAEIARRIRREQCLSLQNEVTRVLTDPTSAVEDLVNSILRIICGRMQWEEGRLWLADPRASVLRCSSVLEVNGQEAVPQGGEGRRGASILPPTRVNGDGTLPQAAEATLNPGSGLAGQVWETGKPVWLADAAQAKARQLSPTEPESWQAHFAFPLRIEGETLGVLEFRSRQVRPREEVMEQMLATLGGLIGHAIERKKLEQQLRHSQKMEAIGHLAGGVAHDFNNILTVIQGYAQILKLKTGLDPETVEALDQVAQASERAASLTRQLLTFSRKQIMQPRPLDLNQVVAHLEKMLRRIIGEDIALVCQPSAQPAAVVADEDMVAQILMNLACNARDAMSRGGRLVLSTETVLLAETAARQSPEARSGEFVCLRVSDTGCGIPPEHLPRIFEPFFTTKEVGRGTGLGLCTVYGIVKQHHGWIEVASRPGAGTTFSIFLPRAPLPVGARDHTHPESEVSAGEETILLVEDETPVRCLTRNYLQRLGYRVIEAASGIEALFMWEQQAGTIDLLLTDMVMPNGISGSDLAGRLRARQPNLAVLCISGYTATQGSSINHIVQDAGFLHKPFSPQTLGRAVRECLDSGHTLNLKSSTSPSRTT